ncbi:hypothetical protein LTR10_024322 [Elasticomyces elasticus]|uniref:Enoyl reductase (ER) domain-containing protein n=1 Tax=Exophiala sideris TaxID=1016849 RepID=A0ABR0J6L7_9EURO|nr:hypothetical protein LTR10_024322 [Elasticomyces elasticus]KAK5028953.1 hypothetical protein LTS07_006335 [Exophiala sideris]KAK5035822.1 hypothetical protein LTR13_005954 [Exophiala sideris]KAK5057457.1 hypothetical protein LTR69_007499 [Exophiala sideris]KAK5181568.1 hypothetical protein LTR44_005766 [Eurotiomycetes sp. CCFEE 6388]
MPVSHSAQWVIVPNKGIDALQFEEQVTLPDLEERQCLVRVEAASLNYRDIAMALGRYPLPLDKSFVACSDGTGEVIAVGSGVSEFKLGDKVCMTFMQDLQEGIVTPKIRQSTLGSQRDGVLRQYGIFEETGLVLLPKNLSYIEGATLPCAALTAWNCIFGLESRALRRGDSLLTQGTGGVSLFAIQFGLAIGANVISTTSTAEKAERLKALGVQHVINYTSNTGWGEIAKSLTPDGLGVHHIIDVGGENTIFQSLKAVRPEGVVSMVGFLGGKGDHENLPSFSLIQRQLCIVRGMNVGPRRMFQQMNAFMEQHDIRPIISDRIFKFGEAQEAYKEMEKQQFWGKIVIQVQ